MKQPKWIKTWRFCLTQDNSDSITLMAFTDRTQKIPKNWRKQLVRFQKQLIESTFGQKLLPYKTLVDKSDY